MDRTNGSEQKVATDRTNGSGESEPQRIERMAVERYYNGVGGGVGDGVGGIDKSRWASGIGRGGMVEAVPIESQKRELLLEQCPKSLGLHERCRARGGAYSGALWGGWCLAAAVANPLDIAKVFSPSVVAAAVQWGTEMPSSGVRAARVFQSTVIEPLGWQEDYERNGYNQRSYRIPEVSYTPRTVPKISRVP